jgi:hypothetical protein
MDPISPVYAALGFIEYDALNDLAGWLDGRAEPQRTAASADRPTAGGADAWTASAGREG